MFSQPQTILACAVTLGLATSTHWNAARADCVPSATGLVGWWAGDGNADDVLGANSGNLQGGATADAVGKVGAAFVFDGTNSYVQIADAAMLRPSNLTLEAWVRFDALDTPGTAPTGQQYLVYKQNSLNSDFAGYALSKVRVAGGDTFEWRVSAATEATAAVTASTLIATGVWYHVAAVRGSNFLQIHVNGQLQQQGNVSFPQNYGGHPLYFGSSGQAFWERKFCGVLDEVTLYNRALSSSEITAVYNAESDGKCKQVIITRSPQSRNATIGSSVDLSVIATGFGALQYQWLFNGLPIATATNSTLALSNVQLASAGSYVAVVSNTLGAATSDIAVLKVDEPPFITTPPQSVTVVPAANASFSVVSGGTAPLSYQWRKAGEPLPGQIFPTLTLPRVTADDAGEYDVVVSNAAGTITSAPPATLRILPPMFSEPRITSQPQSLRVGIGREASLTVVASGSTPLNYQWRKHQTRLPEGTNATLVLSDVSPNEEGAYDVVVTNIAGSVTSLVATVAVKLVVDPGLESAIGCAITNQTDDLTVADLQGLASLSIRNRGITNLFGLQFASNLTRLDVSQNRITDLTSLGALYKLQSLELDDNQSAIGTLLPLSGLTNLDCLTLSQVFAESYSVLARLTNLRTLTVRGGNVIDLDFVQNLRQLTSLALPQNALQNLTPLAGLTNLHLLDLRGNHTITNFDVFANGLNGLISLHLGDNDITNPPSFQGLARLELLDLADNALERVPPLDELANLRFLALNRNPIADYAGLARLTNLAFLELSGNGISNAAVLAGLTRLTFVDLSFNRLDDLTPLSSLSNLQSLVLAGNHATNLTTTLAAMNNLRDLWLQGCAISNASFVSELPDLRHLNLDDNLVPDVTPLLGLTNLAGLSLSRNSATNVLSVVGLTNLTGLRLEGNNLVNVQPLTNLSRLSYLSLNQNLIADAEPLQSLTNLRTHYLRRNRLGDISYLQFMPQLLAVDLNLNLLHPTNGSLESSIIQGLHCQPTEVSPCACSLPGENPFSRGVEVGYDLQHSAPTISAPSRWFIPWNTPSSVGFEVYYAADPDDPLPVTAKSSTQWLITDVGLNPETTNHSGRLLAVPEPGQTGDLRITLTVANHGGLTQATEIQVSVLSPVAVGSMFPDGETIDPDLESAFRLASDNDQDALTSVDLLKIVSLQAPDTAFAGFSGWQWLTNVKALELSGNSGNLGFLTNLPQLTSLHLDQPQPSELAWLSALPNLTDLELEHVAISNLSFVTPIIALQSLGLKHTHVSDLTPLTGLTNLSQVRCQFNLLTNILGIYQLPRLAYVDVRRNLLDTTADSLPAAIIAGLRAREVEVDELPQRAPPVLELPEVWNVSADRTSRLTFGTLENGEPVEDLLGMQSYSSNLSLFPNSHQTVEPDTNSSHFELALNVTPLPGKIGAATIFIRVTNDVGMSSSTSLVVCVSMSLPLTDEFPGLTDLNWRDGGDVSWFGQGTVSVAGFPAAQSGSITHGQQSILESTLLGPGTLRFWWKVASEDGYDWLRFESSDFTNQISGVVDWEEQEVNIAPKFQTVRWRYTKDSNVARYQDAGWVARVAFIPATWLDLVAAPPNPQSRIELYGVPGQEYQIQISTNVVDWTPLSTIVSTNRVTPFIDLHATNAVRFYRARAMLQPPTLGISNETPDGFDLVWLGVGVLEAAPTLDGPWQGISGVSPCYVSKRTSPAQFFRVRLIGN